MFIGIGVYFTTDIWIQRTKKIIDDDRTGIRPRQHYKIWLIVKMKGYGSKFHRYLFTYFDRSMIR